MLMLSNRHESTEVDQRKLLYVPPGALQFLPIHTQRQTEEQIGRRGETSIFLYTLLAGGGGGGYKRHTVIVT